MQYYRCDKYPIEFVLSENIDKHFTSHNHVEHYVISVVMQGAVAVYLKSSELMCHRGDVLIILPYTVHSVHQGKDARLLSMCIGTAFMEEQNLVTAKDTDGKFSYHLVRIAPNYSIGNHTHEVQLETHEVIAGSGKCINASSAISYEPGTISIMSAGVPHEVIAGSEGLYLFAKFMPALC